MSSGQTIRVVIADDVPDLRALLRAQLELEDGFDVVGEAADGRAAIDVVEETRPDCILLDLAMPVMDGLQAIPEIRRVGPGIVIVVLSGFEAAALEEAALDAGADLYLEKGASLPAVAETLRDVCSRAATTGLFSHPGGVMREARERARLAGKFELRIATLVRTGDRIAIPTSGHSETSPDASLEVLAITGAGRPVFRVRLRDGREDFYVPGREVRVASGV